MLYAARARPDEFIVTQSVLDRIIGWESKLAQDPPANRTQSIRVLKAALRRDLEWLLNTRRSPAVGSDTTDLLMHSLFSYGLPDFSHANVSSPKDRHWLALEVERTVRLFEPRLRDVHVSIVEEADAHLNRALSFQIEGMLDMDPAPELVSFDTVRDFISGTFQVRGEHSA